jgi:hypothetical protein
MTSYRLLILLMLAQTSALHKPRGVTRGTRAHDFCHDHNHEIAIAAHDSIMRVATLVNFDLVQILMRVDESVFARLIASCSKMR